MLFDKRVPLSSMSRTAITLKFKMSVARLRNAKKQKQKANNKQTNKQQQQQQRQGLRKID